jgi:hypothetical protein
LPPFGFTYYRFLLQTAALAQKNSEATRILSAQEDLLEKEIGTIQKVLYAMQVMYLGCLL